nr:FAD-linked oxidase C-terminal domain-containing protein [Microvirga zambiensis]
MPRVRHTALVAVEGIEHCLALLERARAAFEANLTAFEVMADVCLRLVTEHFPDQHLPFHELSPHARWYVLLEIADSNIEDHVRTSFETMLGDAYGAAEIVNAVVANSIDQSRSMWHLRESITLAQAKSGKSIKHDIALPISRIPQFVDQMGQHLSKEFPGLTIMPFGHLGDGNLHYNVASSDDFNPEKLLQSQDEIYLAVHDTVHAYGGSISAEHGVGQLKRRELKRYKTSHELNMMQAIKSALDPLNILNPGKLL